ncbi:MAG TPA: DNA repair protein RecO [Gaiellaceae bacterium]|nr:DNA repair protein RecO [Gaiellaceae bacterium]
MARTYKTEAVVLRSFRLGEADRVLHLYTLARGRIGAVAKGVRKTKSRFGGRLEPLSHVEVMLHQGGGELQTVTGVELIRSHREAREQPYRLGVGLVGAEAMLRLFPEQEANDRAFLALVRFLDLLDTLEPGDPSQCSVDPLVLSFQLKLLWLSGYLPHVTSCAECGAETDLSGYSPKAGGAVCSSCADGGAMPLSRDGLLGIEALLRRPLADAGAAGLTARGAREALRVVTASYEYHGGFRLRTLSA